REERTKPVFIPWLPAPRLIAFCAVCCVRNERRLTCPQATVEFVFIEQLVVRQRIFPETLAGEVGQNVQSKILLDFAQAMTNDGFGKHVPDRSPRTPVQARFDPLFVRSWVSRKRC